MAKAPEFWSASAPQGPMPTLLSPLSALYAGIGSLRRKIKKPYKSRLPVICIGNLVAGGAGKTPTAIAIAKILQAGGDRPHILSRGYGGSLWGPVRVTSDHKPKDVGDEPLLLARHAPVTVARNRVAGAKAIENTNANVIIMDDGFQNPGLHKDLSILVVDAGAGFGNGRVIPAGPLREPVDEGFRRADAIVLIGTGLKGQQDIQGFTGPVVKAILSPDQGIIGWRQKVVAFAGIGRPEKFRETLQELRADIQGFHAFPDHHPYTEGDLALLLETAHSAGALLVTTEKDLVRVPEAIKPAVTALPVHLDWSDEEKIGKLLTTVFAK
ncbi:tetraacyldisaccharide 4'-kinase [Aestuariispira ectoiniformans]|uniref:tetraacyldisaccharide 4'-kinase n=1 Tax=Aestuariispira ectoiniformans TaxID=2775080 RepID=UPI00223C4811|nr:tetraacyldisaccharide 4'-kinase [Aestuariispira ectoiniformans]